MMQHT